MIKKIASTALAVLSCSPVFAANGDSITAGVFHKDVSFDWSIDNSHTPGHLDKESEIIWNTKAVGFEIGLENDYRLHKFYFSKSDDGQMTDDDWKLTSGAVDHWSSTKSDAEYFEVGYLHSGALKIWQNKMGMDSIQLITSAGIRFERWEANGLTNNFTGVESRPSSTKVITNDMYSVQSSLGLKTFKRVGDWKFDALTTVDFNGVYNVDTHHLRSDLDDKSFVILMPYIGFNSQLQAEYALDNGFSLQLGGKYAYSRNMMKPLLVNWSDGAETRTDLNSSTRSEYSVYLNLTKKL